MVLVSLAAVIFAAGFLVLATARLAEFKKNIPLSKPEPTTVSESTSANILAASEDTIPASNLEWLANEALVPTTVLKKMLHTTTVGGEVVEVKREEGKLPGLRDYYTGTEKGFYAYGGLIKIKPAQTEAAETFYFSPRRMEIMEVTDAAGKKIKFDDLKTGMMIEMEETVDLAISNIDDQNVISLTIKVIK